nr:hypothetical protein [Tanacetum cinerariifolium]
PPSLVDCTYADIAGRLWAISGLRRQHIPSHLIPKENNQVNCDEMNFRCSERVMDGNSNDDLNNAGEMDSGDEKIVDVFLDKGDEVIPLEGVGESVNKQFEKTNELE